MNYTQEQENIFDFVKNGLGHGIIDAVAGAGKTTTIINSVSHVPKNKTILFCAFNKSISTEIKSRFSAMGMNFVVVKTIHALGYQLIKSQKFKGQQPDLDEKKYDKILRSKEMLEKMEEHYRAIAQINYLDPDDVYDKRNKYAVDNLIKSIQFTLIDIVQKYRSTLCEDNFEAFKDMLLHFNIFTQEDSYKENFIQEVKHYFACHQMLLEEGNLFSERSRVMDFTDMLYLPIHWGLKPSEIFDYIFIDECQDLSKSQLGIALKHGKSSSRIIAVGDPKQSIYGFTGADIKSFQRIKQKLNSPKELPLTSCFRCPQLVIALAKEIREDIQGFKEEQGNVVSVKAHEVCRIAKANDLIISRYRAPLLAMIFKFINQDIKIQIHEDDAKDIIYELRGLFKPNERSKYLNADNDDFEKIKDESFRRREYKIIKDAERIPDDAERVLQIDKEIRYLNERLDFLHKKSFQWKEECKSIEAILQKINTYITEKTNPIKLSTIHRAKGLEADRVFIIEFDQMPFSRVNQKPWENTQEENLKYVAITRTKHELFLVKPEEALTQEDEGSLFDDLF